MFLCVYVCVFVCVYSLFENSLCVYDMSVGEALLKSIPSYVCVYMCNNISFLDS